jgi:hypothetical protein
MADGHDEPKMGVLGLLGSVGVQVYPDVIFCFHSPFGKGWYHRSRRVS